MALNNRFYFSSPVEVVKVTPKNLEEVAEWCGGKVAKVESRRVKGRWDSYVWVPTPKGAAISWAFPGMFITKRLAVTEKNELKETFSVFRKDYFSKNYFAEIQDAVDQTWERQEREEKLASKEARTVTILVNEDEDLEEAIRKLAGVVNGTYKAVPVPAVPAVPAAKGDVHDPFVIVEGFNQAVNNIIAPELADLPDSPVEQRSAIHEDAVEAAAEAS